MGRPHPASRKASRAAKVAGITQTANGRRGNDNRVSRERREEKKRKGFGSISNSAAPPTIYSDTVRCLISCGYRPSILTTHYPLSFKKCCHYRLRFLSHEPLPALSNTRFTYSSSFIVCSLASASLECLLKSKRRLFHSPSTRVSSNQPQRQ